MKNERVEEQTVDITDPKSATPDRVLARVIVRQPGAVYASIPVGGGRCRSVTCRVGHEPIVIDTEFI